MGEEFEIYRMGSKPMHFVLVHGISHGAWCWYKIRWLLENSGNKVTCIDLKGAGIDRSDSDSVESFEDYNKPLFDFMSALPEDEKVILVGHSSGGLNVTYASQEFGDKIHLAVYVAASMLRFGFSSQQDIQDGFPDLSEFGDVYEVGFGLGDDKPPTSILIRKEFQRKILYHQSPEEDAALASMLLRPGPTALRRTKFRGGDSVEKVRRVYVRTTRDRVMKLAQQDAMIKKWPPSKVFTVESDHSPFFSVPGQLSGLLLKASASNDCY
ncbi:methyl esterase 17 [Tasmannia lanceolata]|uniref:methyl esterase 17 n=1 Tax=Tasmannia lanceolata TaxID=3420 RepID=UPI00406445FD